MKKLLIALLLLGSCTKPDPIEMRLITIYTGRIYNDTTLTADREWVLEWTRKYNAGLHANH